MGWPREHGGQARPMAYLLILLEELAAAGAPFGPLSGCLQVSDSIIRHGSETLQREILPLVARGEATFWQGYSEPGAGSDLLALRTRARLEGDHWVLDGRKIWSSHAGIATYGTVLARTDPASTRNRGLTMLMVDNRLPGMDVRPIRSLTGRVYHYEIFMDGVRVPRDWVLGKPGEGFGQLLKGLDTDRFWGRFYKAPFLRRILGLLVDYVNGAAARRSRWRGSGSPTPPPRSRRSTRSSSARPGSSSRGCRPPARSPPPRSWPTSWGSVCSRWAWSCSAPTACSAAVPLGPAPRRDRAPVPDELGPHARGRHLRDPAHDHRGPRARPARRAAGPRITRCPTTTRCHQTGGGAWGRWRGAAEGEASGEKGSGERSERRPLPPSS